MFFKNNNFIKGCRIEFILNKNNKVNVYIYNINDFNTINVE